MTGAEQPSQGLTGLGGGRHHWPVTLRHGPVVLAPLRHRDGAAWDSPWTYRLLRSRANSIEGGTTEILKNIIAERVLGLPKLR